MGIWGFDGVVVSDWGGVHDTKEAIYNGLDMEFGTWTDGLKKGTLNAFDNYYLAVPFLKLIQNGEVNEEEVNKKVRHILRLVFRTTMAPNRPWGSFASPQHALAGRKIAQEGIVLLKNKNNLLPVDTNKIRKIIVIGENAVKKMTVGGGSSTLKVKHEQSPLAGLKERFGAQVQIVYQPGYCSEKEVLWDPADTVQQKLSRTMSPEELAHKAVEAVKGADIVLFFGGLNKNDGQDSEGNDRKNYNLPYQQDALIQSLARANPNIAVILISGNAVAMPWVADVPTIVQAWYGGSEAGNAIASIIAGDVNPSGKLPFTFPVSLQDNGAHVLGDYPGNGKEATYREGLFVGYRWTDRHNVTPMFSFGHGLSYTTFAYGKATLNKKVMHATEEIIVSIPVKNTGKRDGAEIVQLYISDKKSRLPRPVKELKGFKKIYLKPGEEQSVSFVINEEALAYFDPDLHEWIAEPGKFEILLGASSTDIRARLSFELK